MQKWTGLYNYGVKFFKTKVTFGALIASVMISGCSQPEYYAEGYVMTYEVYRAGLQSLKPFIASGENFNTEARYAFLEAPWWGCLEDSKNFLKFRENVKGEGKFNSTLNWEQVGYCLPQVDTIINGYLDMKIWKDTEINYDGLDPVELDLIKKINPLSKRSIELGCKKIIPTDQSSIQKSYRNSDIDADLVFKGCVARFEDTFTVRIAQAKFNSESLKAAKLQNEEAERFNAEAQKQADLAAQKQEEVLKSVDTNSREYITGLTIGNNFSDFSDAGASAEKVCATARDRRIVLSSRGGVGVDPKTASFLNTDDGFQGCIDGFNGVPQD